MKNLGFLRWTCALIAVAVTCGIGAAETPRELRADDGTALTLIEQTIRVAEDRTKPGAAGAIDLFVVRIGRSAARAKSAHIILAGGPGDSGATLVTGLARRGGASLFDMLDGDLIGIDQRGTGKSSPNLQAQALYGLPLDQQGTPESWLSLMEKPAAKWQRRSRNAGFGSRPTTPVRARTTSRMSAERSVTSASRCGAAATDLTSRWRHCAGIRA